MTRSRLAAAAAKGLRPLSRTSPSGPCRQAILLTAYTRAVAQSSPTTSTRAAASYALSGLRLYSSVTVTGPEKPTLEARKQWREQLADFAKQDKTPLYDFHLAHGGKMVLFGGYHMPVEYAGFSLAQSHHFTREHASLFDVSHMVQHRFTGPEAAAFLERITPSTVSDMPINSSKLSALLWPGTGGIADDTMITRTGEQEYRLVSNAGTREKVLAYLVEQTKELQNPEDGGDAFWWEVLQGLGLLAVQGPESEGILQRVIDPAEGLDLSKVYFGQTVFARLRARRGGEWVTLPGRAMISRGGYTGEDGFEVSFESPGEEATLLATTMLETAGPEKLRLAGLGARDSLRLEAGMCLYGHELDDSTTPVEAGLSWLVPKERRTAGAGFHGAEVIASQLVAKSKGGAGVERRRVGLVVKVPAREGAELLTKEGEKVGVVTSGAPSPTLGKNIAMAYVRDGMHKAGTELDVVVRGKKRAATVTKMPFVPSKYYKPATSA
ncbi:aminomethyltransferase [Sodiomyces alkalinus F11]|uniref:Aminomethyltransferase n=1 Tax=Sodiomyces alkalinus (strain CBS 110278 / VKM F-3762 / F11) TaxID=1314773 RepID=A0A3N2PR33_SODAK|nr:aminomethyltransferase [Sodiomyces alkalinus F11]ROT36967.1 aminomethyltransferase [Sodiomyces alkalinus F11]